MGNMTTKEAVDRYVEALNSHDPEALGESVTADMVSHGVFGVDGPIHGRDNYVEAISGFFEALPDLTFDVSTVIAEGDVAAAQWSVTGTQEGSLGEEIPPTGNEVRVDANAIFRVGDGKVAEKWYRMDDLGFLQQIGVVPDM